MRNLLYTLIISIIVQGCSDEPFTGYIVGKEYTPAHMSDEDPSAQTYCVEEVGVKTTMSYVPIPTYHKPAAHQVDESYILVVANRSDVRRFSVSEELFYKCDCGDKITLR